MSRLPKRITWNSETGRYILVIDQATFLDLIDALSCVHHIHLDTLKSSTTTTKYARMIARTQNYRALAFECLSAAPRRQTAESGADRRFQRVLMDSHQAG